LNYVRTGFAILREHKLMQSSSRGPSDRKLYPSRDRLGRELGFRGGGEPPETERMGSAGGMTQRQGATASLVSGDSSAPTIELGFGGGGGGGWGGGGG
jgi:hypothetical protein